MPLATERAHFSPEAYLEWEKLNETKHEYLNGEAFALAGAKDTHLTVCINLVSMINSHLRGGPCQPYS